MGLAQARRPDETEGPALGDEALVEVAQEHLAVQLGTEAEVEVVHRLLEREAGVLEAPAELVVFPGEQLLLQQPAEEVNRPDFPGGSTV
jgi:hypothetical protein